jgi:hypothetical protein
MMRKRKGLLTVSERVELAIQLLGPGSEQDMKAAIDWIEEIRRNARQGSQDPLYDWRGELRAFIAALKRVLSKTKLMRKKMPRPGLLDSLDAECEKWIGLCQGQLDKHELKSGSGLREPVKEFRRPRRHDADVKRRAAERARALMAKYSKPGSEHKLAAILYGDESADLRKYCGPQISKGVGLAGRFFFDFPSRGTRATGSVKR